MQTTAQTTQNPLGLTRRDGTAKPSEFAPVASTAVHAPSATPTAPPRPARKRHYTPRARRCAVCGEPFTPARNKSAKTCSTACRSKLHRRRQAAKHKPTPDAERPLIAATCDHCRRGFMTTNRLQTHCSPSCRTLASRARRKAAETALIASGLENEIAADLLEAAGLAAVNAQLQALGMHYDPAARAYRPALPTSGNMQNPRSAA
jgi:predicted nucleic acid-binding Zn ribbon protein